MIMTMILTLLLSLCLTSLAQTAPDWRGSPGSSWQSFEWSNGWNDSGPEQDSNSWGTATAHLDYGWAASGWYRYMALAPGREGMFDVGGTNGRIILTIPCTTNATDYRVQVQVVWFYDPDTMALPPILDVPGSTLQAHRQETLQVDPIGGQWELETWVLGCTNPPTTITLNAPATGFLSDSVTVDVLASLSPLQTIRFGNQVQLVFTGVSQSTYVLQSTTNLVEWSNKLTFICPPYPFTFLLGTGLGQEYFRIVSR